MSDYIKVKPTKDDGKVCLWEQSDQHPNNEIFIKNDGQIYTVGLTSEVAQRIKDGELVEVDSKSVTVDEPVAQRIKDGELVEVDSKSVTVDEPVAPVDPTPADEPKVSKRVK